MTWRRLQEEEYPSVRESVSYKVVLEHDPADRSYRVFLESTRRTGAKRMTKARYYVNEREALRYFRGRARPGW